MIYERRFGLEKNPFRMTPDPSFLYLTPMHREALSGLIYSILENKAFVVLTGEAGTGKTTLLSHVLRYLSKDRVNFSLLVNPTLSTGEFLEAVLTDFGMNDIPESKVQRLLQLQHFLTDAHLKGRTSVLVVDEAHKLSAEVLEEIRLLTNFETSEQKLLQIVLVGQGELKALLGRPDLRQLKQRIAARFELQPLDPGEVSHYIQFRWTAAGGSLPLPFGPAAIERIARASSGIPRLINAVCDNALLLVFATERETVELEDVEQVLADLELREFDFAPPAVASLNGHRKTAEPQVQMAPQWQVQVEPTPLPPPAEPSSAAMASLQAVASAPNVPSSPVAASLLAVASLPAAPPLSAVASSPAVASSSAVASSQAVASLQAVASAPAVGLAAVAASLPAVPSLPDGPAPVTPPALALAAFALGAPVEVSALGQVTKNNLNPIPQNAPLQPIRIRTLERYDTSGSSRGSLWMRWAGRLGF